MVILQNASIEHNTRDATSAISKETLIFLKKSMHEYPEIVCWIVNKLISVIPKTSRDIVSDLHDVYFSTLKLCLEHIPVRKDWYSSREVLESHSLEANSVNRGNYLRTLLCLLSRMNLDVDVEIEFLRTAYHTLSKTRNVKDIELALYSRHSENLFSEWLSLCETHACSESAVTLAMAYKISDNMLELTEDSRVALCKRELLKRINTRKSHWLNDILVSAKHFKRSMIF